MAFWDWFKTSWEPITEQATMPVAESFMVGGYDPDANHTAAQVGSAYARRIGGANPKRDLDPASLDKARDTAVAGFVWNPLAKRFVEINRDWIMGEGMSIVVEPDQGDIQRRDRKPGATETVREANEISGRAQKRQKERQEVVNRFWNAPGNNLDLKLFDHVLSLGLFGELLLRVAVNPANGAVKIGVVDPGHIHRVIVDVFNCCNVLAVELKPPSPSEPPPRLKHVAVDEDVTSKTFGRYVGAAIGPDGEPVETYRVDDKTLTYAGSCLFWSINKVPTAERGISDLVSVMEFIDWIDQMHASEADRSLLTKVFAWDVKMLNAGPAEVEARRKELTANPPKPGSVNVHNDKEEWTVPAPALNQWDYQSGIEVLINHVCAGAGVPKGWVNGVQDVNKAQATEMSEPTMKRFEARQKYIVEQLEVLCSFALDQAELRGRITRRRHAPGVIPDAWPLKVVAPEIRGRDLAATSTALKDTATALVAMLDAGIVSMEVAQEAAAVNLGDYGVEIDLETMREQIEERQAETEKKEQAAAATELEQQTDAQIAVKKAAPPPTPVRRAG